MEGMESPGKGPSGGGSVVGIQTWQTQTLRVCNTCVNWDLFLLPSSHKSIRRTAATEGAPGRGQFCSLWWI